MVLRTKSPCTQVNDPLSGIDVYLLTDHKRLADYSAASAASVSNTTGTGVFILLLLNLIIFVMDHTFHLPQIQRLYLDHLAPRWWQFLTSSFCHASWAHLSNNTFLLYVFGKIVEEEEGLWGVWFTYIITAVGEDCTDGLLSLSLAVWCMSCSTGISLHPP